MGSVIMRVVKGITPVAQGKPQTQAVMAVIIIIVVAGTVAVTVAVSRTMPVPISDPVTKTLCNAVTKAMADPGPDSMTAEDSYASHMACADAEMADGATRADAMTRSHPRSVTDTDPPRVRDIAAYAVRPDRASMPGGWLNAMCAAAECALRRPGRETARSMLGAVVRGSMALPDPADRTAPNGGSAATTHGTAQSAVCDGPVTSPGGADMPGSWSGSAANSPGTGVPYAG